MRYKIPPKRRTPGTMNSLEKKYAERLEMQKQAGEILDYKFESVKFRLAPKTFYTPDFMVIYPDGIGFHETKGFMRDDANVKLKVVAETYQWFDFLLVEWRQKAWKFTEIGNF
jgi:hypothetical protein